MIKKLANSFRQTVSGNAEGRPAWVQDIEEGTDNGLFGSNSAVWEVHGAVPTLIGGIRALLLQAAHPAALAGVKTHSRYETDLLGRLQGTSKWLAITTFGPMSLINKEAARVNAMHDRVKGFYKDKYGNENPYIAKDDRFLLWVHCAFTESFLEAHLLCKYPLKHGADAYVREWSASAKPLGLNDAPQTYQELREEINRFINRELVFSADTKEVIKFILNPPFGFFAKFFFKPLAKSAVRSLSDGERQLLQLKNPGKYWEWIARSNLWLLKKALGPRPPAQDAAIKRIARLNGK